jgi:hypothetical protein
MAKRVGGQEFCPVRKEEEREKKSKVGRGTEKGKEKETYWFRAWAGPVTQ